MRTSEEIQQKADECRERIGMPTKQQWGKLIDLAARCIKGVDDLSDAQKRQLVSQVAEMFWIVINENDHTRLALGMENVQ